MGDKNLELRRFVAELKPDEIMYLLYTKEMHNEIQKQFLFPYYSTYT